MEEVKHILLVEDEAAHMELIRRAFKGSSSPYRLWAVESLSEVEKYLEAHTPHLIITDWKLPDGNGLKLVGRKRDGSEVPVVIMTSHGNERVVVAALQAGALDYVVKSVETMSDMPHTAERSLREWDHRAEQTRMQNALRESEKKYRFLAENVADVIWTADTNLRVTYISPSVEKLQGWTVHEWLDLRPQDYISPRSLQATLQLVADEVRLYGHPDADPNRSLVFENEQLRKDGSVFWAEVTWRFLRDERGAVTGSIGVTRDISERKRAEIERLELARRLLQSQKLESLGILAGGIAHDFNNLLMIILGNMELALHDLPPSSPSRSSIEQAMQASLRAAELTRQMLAYSGRGRFAISRVDLSELAREDAALFRSAIGTARTLTLSLASKPCVIEADPGQVKQIIMNLVTNASEALGKESGVITLATGMGEFDAAYLGRSRITEKPAAGRFAYLEVSDTGCGMNDEIQQRLFDPFFTTKSTGRGLGMSVVMGIVRGHKGALLVDSTVGRGSAVRVLFPVCEPQGVTPAESSFAAPSRPRTRLKLHTVLVVDDEEGVRNLCVSYVQRLGFKSLSAANGEEALVLFKKHADKIGCVLLDLTMPKMDGASTFRKMRRFRPEVPVILCSGYDEQNATHKFAGQGLAAFIQKPFRLQDLKKKIARALQQGHGKSPE